MTAAMRLVFATLACGKNYLRQVTQLDGFQGPDAFRAQLLQDMREMEAVKKKLEL